TRARVRSSNARVAGRVSVVRCRPSLPAAIADPPSPPHPAGTVPPPAPSLPAPAAAPTRRARAPP
ncbi:hypothetical protein NGM37_46230, partial [Streptomyces sp. TRM76130]|nr:hypothetical protein [Streptomyces sp. TRM76130]